VTIDVGPGADARPPDTAAPEGRDAAVDASPEAFDAVDEARDAAVDAPPEAAPDLGPDTAVPCVAFDTAACAAAGPYGGTCLPDGAGHLACVPGGQAPEGAACVVPSDDPASSCSLGLACVEGACAVPCHRNAPACPEGQWCRGAFPDLLELGVCFQRACTPYLPGSCGAPDLQCLPGGPGTGSCQLAGGKTDGQACGSGVGLCAEGLTCLLEGPHGGRCVPFCDPAVASGSPAACPGDGLACVDIGVPSFGLCLTACGPWEPVPGTSVCATGQACSPVDADAGACYTAGTAAVGEPCAKAGAWWACAPGALCTAPAADAPASCERTCRPFGPASDCPGPGTFCALRKTWLGTCQAGALNLPVGAPCGPSGAWCGPNVRCLDLGSGAGPTCVAYCRVGADDCPAGRTCLQSYGVDSALGLCW